MNPPNPPVDRAALVTHCWSLTRKCIANAQTAYDNQGKDMLEGAASAWQELAEALEAGDFPVPPDPQIRTPCGTCGGKGYYMVHDDHGNVKQETNCPYCDGSPTP